MTDVHVVVPEGIDDPARPSGGNAYDRQVCRGLAAGGWTVHEHHVAVGSPAALLEAVRSIPDGAVALVDGLLASPAPALVPHAGRLRLVVLVHMPFETAEEGTVLAAAAAVVATSAWTRQRLLQRYALPVEQLHVAEPAVAAAELAPGTESGGELLCVAAVTPGKGHDVLVDALGEATDLDWRCLCVGSLEREPVFAASVQQRVEDRGLAGRVRFAGPRVGAALDQSYAAADLLVLASRGETYGMVVSEALARGLPVVAAEVGGVPEALGRGDDGTRPGLLVPPEDPAALREAIRAWLGDDVLRARLRRAARERRAALRGWSSTSAAVAGVLQAVAR